MSNHVRNILIVVGAAFSLGCNSLTSTVCTNEARPAISVEALDSTTNASVRAGARIIASDGAFADTVITVEDFGGAYGLAHEREGSYAVTVEQEGYAPWSRSDVEVTRDECHVRTVRLTALLQS
ncbi:MAG TPA: carboxypeptidase-like regulatory domain-containing protein [Gemmatimonadaceae bacterium]|jgi:hypothetical protein|nr:carboxypeptidase-like regulatory domain-containing protein [Gemmatimonadaceae bacterium]